MIKLALIGKSISHSMSQKVYEDILGKKIIYDLIDCDSDHLIPNAIDLLSEYQGVSITSPYKKHFLNQAIADESVQLLGALNCISRVDNDIYSFNTDYLAFRKLVLRYGIRQATLLGDGVMAKMACILLKELDIPYEVLSRKNGLLTKNVCIAKKEKGHFVINCCSREYLFDGEINASSTFWDLNYKMPEQEYLLTEKCQYIDGYELLEGQAQEALKIWDI